MGIAANGTYNMDVDLYFISTTAATRVSLYVDLVVIRETVIVATLTSTGSEYYRGSTGTNQGYLNISATTDLLAGDMVELRMREASATSAVFTVGGLNSRIDITQIVGTPTVTVTGFPTPGLVGAAYSGTLVAIHLGRYEHRAPCGRLDSAGRERGRRVVFLGFDSG